MEDVYERIGDFLRKEFKDNSLGDGSLSLEELEQFIADAEVGREQRETRESCDQYLVELSNKR